MRRAPRETVSSLCSKVQTFLDLCSLQVWVSKVQPVEVHVVNQIPGEYVQMLLEFNEVWFGSDQVVTQLWPQSEGHFRCSL